MGRRAGRDRADGPPPSADDIERIGRAVLAELPEPFRSHVGGVVIRVQDFADEATLEQMGIESPFDLLGLYHGIPVGHDSSLAPPRQDVDMIFLYRRALLDYWCETGLSPRRHRQEHADPRDRPPFRLFRRRHGRDRVRPGVSAGERSNISGPDDHEPRPSGADRAGSGRDGAVLCRGPRDAAGDVRRGPAGAAFRQRRRSTCISRGTSSSPRRRQPTPGSADLCFLTETPVGEVATHLQGLGYTLIEGPVERTGATGPLRLDLSPRSGRQSDRDRQSRLTAGATIAQSRYRP